MDSVLKMAHRFRRLWILAGLISAPSVTVIVYREELVLWGVQLQTASTLASLRDHRNSDLRTVDEKGIHLRPSRKEFFAGDPYLFRQGLKFKWCVPPPSGEELRYSASKPHEKAGGGRATYYAYSLDMIAGRRFFVFLGKLKPNEFPYYGWFREEEVSWYFQVLLSDLNADELRREQDFREKCNHRFPIQMTDQNQ